MALRLNRTLFQQTDADSGALSMLGTVVHGVADVGHHRGTVYRGKEAVGEFTLRVEEAGPLQVHVDLAAQGLQGASGRRGAHGHQDGCCDHETGAGGAQAAAVYTVGRDGHAVFHVSSGSGGYAVTLADTGRGEVPGEDRDRREEQGRVWDSRRLEAGDLFGVTLLRPGAYRVSGEGGRAEARLRLAYPQRGRTAYRPPEPLHIAVSEDGFDPKDIELQPLQGQVYEIRTGSRVVISLVEPDDGPQQPDRPQAPRLTLRRRHVED